MEHCPRALEVLKRQLALRARLKLAGKLNHEELFFKGNGDPIHSEPLGPLEAQLEYHAEGSVPRTLQRATLLAELEFNGRQESVIGCKAARPQCPRDV
jgi:hypothetical protein